MNKTKSYRKKRRTTQRRRRKQMRGGYGTEVERYSQLVHLENGGFFWETYSMMDLTDYESMQVQQAIGIINDNGCHFINENQYESRHAGGFTPRDLRGTSLSIGIFPPAKSGEPLEKEMVFIFYHQIHGEEAIPIGFISCSVKGNLCLTKYECFNSIKVRDMINEMFKSGGGIYTNTNTKRAKSVAKHAAPENSRPSPKPKYKEEEVSQISREYKIKASHILQAFYIRRMYKLGVQTIYKNPVEEAIQYNRDTGFLVFSNIDEEFPLESEMKETRRRELQMTGLERKVYSYINTEDVMTGSPQLTYNVSYNTKNTYIYRQLLAYMNSLAQLES
jgi:hypothetical protein